MAGFLQERNRRALELLLQKDQVISSLQAQLHEAATAREQAEAEAAEQAASAAAAAAKADALLAALRDAGDVAASDIRKLQQQHEAAIAALEQKVETEHRQLQAASQQVLDLSAQLAVMKAEHTSGVLSTSVWNAVQQPDPSEGSISLGAGIGRMDREMQQQQHPDAPVTAEANTDNNARNADRGSGQALCASTTTGTCSIPKHADLLAVLGDRDAAIARLQSQLAVAHAAVEGRADLPGESSAAAQVRVRHVRHPSCSCLLCACHVSCG